MVENFIRAISILRFIKLRIDDAMIKTELAQEHIREFKNALDSLDLAELDKIIEILLKAYKENRQVFVIGNGGSASLASHFACDLSKGTLQNAYDDKEKRFKVISLTDNTALMTAYSNDLAYEHVFSQQLRNLLSEGDVVIGISSSGNSKNIINAINLAKKNRAVTVGLLGFDGGKLRDIVDFKILVNNYNYGIVEDSHSVLQHIICSVIRKTLKN